LKQLPEPAFAAFIERGHLAEVDAVSDDYLRSAYLETLRRNLNPAKVARDDIRLRLEQEHLARELAERRRIAQEKQRRENRVRATPVYRELRGFMARARCKDESNRKLLANYDSKLIEASAAFLAGGPNDTAELQQALAQLKEQQANEQKRIARWKEELEERISRLRANVKERIRTYQRLDAADWAAFDLIVDWELDAFWKGINQAKEEEFDF
jgi:hypothetical protein